MKLSSARPYVTGLVLPNPLTSQRYRVKKSLLVLAAGLAWCILRGDPAASYSSLTPVSPTTEWTVMVFMNARNSLSDFAPINLAQLKSVPTSSAVKIVVEWGSLAWRDHVYRFLLTPETILPNGSSLPPLGGEDLGDTDMGSDQTLAAFVDWAKTKYPAKRYMLVLWDHGAGFRVEYVRQDSIIGAGTGTTPLTEPLPGGLVAVVVPKDRSPQSQLAASDLVRSVASARINSIAEAAVSHQPRAIDYVYAKAGHNWLSMDPALWASSKPLEIRTEIVGEFQIEAPDWTSTYRAISNDDFSKNHLYNRQIQEVLRARPVDVIGFDACLMSMVETAYAMRKGAKTMVGSEELEPGLGWRYDDWLTALTMNPTMDGDTLGIEVVKSYRKKYTPLDRTATLSCTRLDRVDILAVKISLLADTLATSLSDAAVKYQIRDARMACQNYAPRELAYNYVPNPTPLAHPRFSFVDMAAFCTKLGTINSPAIQAAANDVLVALQNANITAWAGSQRIAPPWLSKGLSIYFPRSGAVYLNDLNSPEFGPGYEKANGFQPVDFVRDTTWTDFLHEYFDSFPTG